LTFDLDKARQIAATCSINSNSEQNLVESFAQICSFLADNPDRMSWRGKNSPSIFDEEGLKILANRYFSSYRKSDFPAIPSTVPDQMVSIVMEEAYGYTPEQCEQIKVSHQHSMCAENCVGALLERYLDSVLRSHDWYWCCGDFVKAIDFVKRDPNGIWLTLQIKNRDNSENSSSSAIRHGTPIQKWFRSFSKKEDTNWKNLPELMQGYSLDENGFIEFVKSYLKHEKEKIHQ
jgi:SinI restriction endonuclease